MSVASILNYTYEDYLNWEGDWELIDGYPVSMAPAPMRIHQNIATEVLFLLKVSKAKIYTLKSGKYFKVGDYTNERLDFDDLECDISLDFEKVFRRFKNR